MKVLGIGLLMGAFLTACNGVGITDTDVMCQSYFSTIDSLAEMGENNQLTDEEIIQINRHRLSWREACIMDDPAGIRMNAVPLITIEKGKQAWLSQQSPR